MSNNARYGVCYFAPLSFSTGAPFSATITDFVNAVSGSMVITGTYFIAASGTVDGILYENFCKKFESVIEATTGNDYNVFFDPINGRMFIECENSQRAVVRFSGAQSARVFGCSPLLPQNTSSFQDASGANYTGISGNFYPWSFWKSQYSERSDWRLNYEPEPFYFDHEADDGAVFSIGRLQSAVYSDWMHKFELQTHVRSELATTMEPYVWQYFLNDVRSTKPFLVLTASNGNPASIGGGEDINRYERVAKLRAEGSNFNPEYQDLNEHRWHHLKIMTRLVSSSSFEGA